MLIIGLNGSPKEEGNSFALLSAALEGAREKGAETGIIHIARALQGSRLPYCDNCAAQCEGACARGNSLGEAFELLKKADGILMASPVYFGTVSAQLKAFWDKTRFLRKQKALVDTVGGALAVGASRFGGQETTIKAIHDMMLVQGMTVVGDGYMEDDAGHQGACAQRPAGEDVFGLVRARILGKRVAELARFITLGRTKQG